MSCDFRRGKDDTNLERSETSGLSRGHVDACLGPYLVRALASRVSISYLLRVSPDPCRRLRGRTGLRRWLNTILHICTATTPDSEKRPCVNPSRSGQRGKCPPGRASMMGNEGGGPAACSTTYGEQTAPCGS